MSRNVDSAFSVTFNFRRFVRPCGASQNFGAAGYISSKLADKLNRVDSDCPGDL